MAKISPPKFLRNWFIPAVIAWLILAAGSGWFFFKHDWQESPFLGIYHVIIFLLGTLSFLLFNFFGRKRLTEIAKTNKILAQNEKMLQGIIDNTESGIAVYDVNPDGSQFTLKWLNPARSVIYFSPPAPSPVPLVRPRF